MTAYLMIVIGVLACVFGFAGSYRRGAPTLPASGDSRQASIALRALLAAFALDLVLQLWQIDGARQPVAVAIVDAVTTGGIFWLLAAYIAALTGTGALPRGVSRLAGALILLGIARAVLRATPLDGAKPSTYYALSVVWLMLGLALALALAYTAHRALRRAAQGKEARRKGGVGWAEVVAWWTYVIAALVVLRAIAAPFLGGAPMLARALDTPLVDTLLIVAFVALGAAMGGLAQISPPPRERVVVDDETAARHARLLARADAMLDRDFADPMLTMPRLAAAIGCSEHQLSAALNHGRGVNFFAYLNARRVRAAMAMIDAGGMTMTEIAFACGYNARSTFYAAFKSVTGQSPGAWRADDATRAVSLS